MAGIGAGWSPALDSASLFFHEENTAPWSREAELGFCVGNNTLLNTDVKLNFPRDKCIFFFFLSLGWGAMRTFPGQGTRVAVLTCTAAVAMQDP